MRKDYNTTCRSGNKVSIRQCMLYCDGTLFLIGWWEVNYNKCNYYCCCVLMVITLKIIELKA